MGRSQLAIAKQNCTFPLCLNDVVMSRLAVYAESQHDDCSNVQWMVRATALTQIENAQPRHLDISLLYDPSVLDLF